MGIGTYKEFIALLKREIVELDDYPLKSIYRKLKRIMNTDFDTIVLEEDIEEDTWRIVGEYKKERNGCFGKSYEINKKTGRVVQNSLNALAAWHP